MRKTILFLTLSFFLLFNSVDVFALDSFILSFVPSDNKKTFAFLPDTESLSWSIKRTFGNVDNYNFKVYDKFGTLIQEGQGGSLKMLEDYYPITFVSDVTFYDARIDLELKPVPKKDIVPFIDEVEGKLDSLGSKLDSLLSKFSSLNDFLTNPAPLNASIGNLSNAIQDMSNKGVLGQIKSFSKFNEMLTTDTPDSGDMPRNLTFLVTFPEIGTFNVLDLSKFAGVMKFIRDLMLAMMFIGLFIYFIRYIMPKFNV